MANSCMPSGHPRGQAGYPDFLLFGEKKDGVENLKKTLFECSFHHVIVQEC
jgi:hypothetical protein